MFPDLVLRCAPALTPAQAAALEAHYSLLCRWNKVLNLTTVDRLAEAVERHYCESLFLAARLPDAARIADIGSGAGFPGFVVAVAKPACQVTLIESHQRKAVFLREAARGMANVRVLSRRAEEIEERFDWVVSRAVSYADLGKSALRLAPRLALLTGVETPPAGWNLVWESILLPGSRDRYLRLGEPQAG